MGDLTMSIGLVLFSLSYTLLQAQAQQLQAHPRNKQQDEQPQQQEDVTNSRRIRTTSYNSSSTKSSLSATTAATALAAATASHLGKVATPTIQITVKTPVLLDAFEPVSASPLLVLRYTGDHCSARMIVPLLCAAVDAPRVLPMPVLREWAWAWE